jgi:multidrug transporter EmrE-like cation transporter
MTYIVFVLAIILNAVANILMKVGALKPKEAANVSDVFFNMVTNPAIIAGIACFALGLAAYNYVLIKTDLSVAYPIMTSVGYVIVVLASWLFLKETITPIQTAGLALIVAGVWMVAAR